MIEGVLQGLIGSSVAFVFLSIALKIGNGLSEETQLGPMTTRKRFPDRTFVTSSNYLDTQYLPAASYYSLRDAETDEVVIPFDTSYTKLSADSEGMYFDLWMEGLQPERYYKFEIRIASGSKNVSDQIVNYYDDNFTFKVTR